MFSLKYNIYSCSHEYGIKKKFFKHYHCRTLVHIIICFIDFFYVTCPTVFTIYSNMTIRSPARRSVLIKAVSLIDAINASKIKMFKMTTTVAAHRPSE